MQTIHLIKVHHHYLKMMNYLSLIVQHTLLNLTLIKKNSRSNSEIDEVLECVSDKKLNVTRGTPSFKTARCLAYGTPTNNHYENENDQGIIIYYILYVFVTVKQLTTKPNTTKIILMHMCFFCTYKCLFNFQLLRKL